MVTDLSVVEQQSMAMLEQSRQIAANIKVKADYDFAGEIRNRLKAQMDQWTELTQPSVDTATKALEAARALRDKILVPAKACDRLLMDGRASWKAEQERIEAERRRKEEEERRRVAAEAAAKLRAQLEAEAAARREEARKEEEARRLAAAAEAEARGAEAAAVNAILDTPVEVVVDVQSAEEISAIVEATQQEILMQAPVSAPATKAQWAYSCEVVNLKQLVDAISGGGYPISLVEANQTALNGMARALKDAFNVPGCRVKKTPVDNRRSK